MEQSHDSCIIRPSSTVSIRTERRRTVQDFLLIWFDADIKEFDETYQNVLTELRCIVNDIFTFNDFKQCIDFLQTIRDERVFIIISSVSSKEMIPLIHHNQQLDAIYIFDATKSISSGICKRETWNKVAGHFIDMKSICDALKQAVQQCDKDSTAMSFLSMDDLSYPVDQNRIDPTFMYTQLVKEALLEITFDRQSIEALSNFCREKYRENTRELQKINKFQQHYQLHTPIWWYTSDCCLHHILNRALRTFEIDIILKMGFFIADIHRQIEQLYKQQQLSNRWSCLTVYRGQGLSKKEFNYLNESKSGLISFNGFLSTSRDRHVSLEFARMAARKPDFVGILFVITADCTTVSTPFAVLDKISYYQDSEQEVLFSMHTVFRFDNIVQLNESNSALWQIQLTLTNDCDPALKTLTKQIRQNIAGATGWYRLGQLLVMAGAYDKAETLYTLLIEQITIDDHHEQGHIYHMLGMIKIAQGEYSTAVSFYKKSLEFQEKLSSDNQSNLASAYNNIGSAYEKLNEDTEALTFLEKALAIRQQLLPVNHSDLADSYNNIGLIYAKMRDYPKALSYYKKDLEISEKSLPSNHPDLGTSYNNIASLYNRLGEYSLALEFYEKALKISQQSLPWNHPDLAATYNNIGAVYFHMEEYSRSVRFYERALDIAKQSLSPYHPNLAIAHNNTAFVYYQIGDCSRALSSYEKVLEIRQKLLSDNHPDLAVTNNSIGKVFERMGNFTRAIIFYQHALDILKQSLPVNHPDIKIYNDDLENVKQRAMMD